MTDARPTRASPRGTSKRTSGSSTRSRPSRPNLTPPQRKSRWRGYSPKATTSPRSPAPSASPVSRRTPQPTLSTSAQSSSNDSTTSPRPPAHATTRPTWRQSSADQPRAVMRPYRTTHGGACPRESRMPRYAGACPVRCMCPAPGRTGVSVRLAAGAALAVPGGVRLGEGDRCDQERDRRISPPPSS